MESAPTEWQGSASPTTRGMWRQWAHCPAAWGHAALRLSFPLCVGRGAPTPPWVFAAAAMSTGAHIGAPLRKSSLLLPEILSRLFHHLADGQVVRAARLTGAATYAGAGLFVQRGVALAPPLLQAVPI